MAVNFVPKYIHAEMPLPSNPNAERNYKLYVHRFQRSSFGRLFLDAVFWVVEALVTRDARLIHEHAWMVGPGRISTCRFKTSSYYGMF